MVGVVLNGLFARLTLRLNGGGVDPQRVGASLLLLLLCHHLLPLASAEAKPHEVNFEGVGIPVESQTSLGGGMVAIRFASEDFVTAEAQAGRSVAIRLVRTSTTSALVSALLVPIVEKAMARGDSQLLNVAIDAELSRDQNSPEISTEIWKRLLAAPLGRTLLAEALQRRRDTFSISLCSATLMSSEQGIATELSEEVATRCLDSEVERVGADLRSGQQLDMLVNRTGVAVRAFGVANVEALQNARLFEGHLKKAAETVAIEEYLVSREYLSRHASQRASPQEVRGVFGSLDDAFLNRLSGSGKNGQAILSLAEVPFESRTQRTHHIVLNILGALRPDEYGALRQRPAIAALSRFADRDSEIATTLGDAMARVVSDASARGLFQEVSQIAIELQGAPESVKQALDSVIASAVTALLARSERERAEELMRSWARPLPLSVRFRWWIGEGSIVRSIGALVVIFLFIVVIRRARAKKRRSGEDMAPIAQSWPVGYEEALQQVGLAPGISLVEIKQAYRAAVKREHPDLKPNATPEDQEKFRQIVASFERVMELHQRIH